MSATSRYPWVLIGLLWMVAFLNAADRSILFTVMPQLKTEFGLTPTQLALLNSVFFWVYAVGAFLSGSLGDRARRSRVIIYGLLFWSMATGIVSLSTGFTMLLGLRALVAMGEATYYPTATALISDWHRPEMRGRALSLHQTAVFAGAGMGALAAGYMADALGWQAPFLIFGGIGFIVVAILFKFLRDAPAKEAAVVKSAKAPLGTVLGIPPALMLCIVFFLANGASTGVTVWAPTFVHDALGLNLGGSALVGAATIQIAGFLTVPFSGLLGDYLSRRTPIGRFYTLAIGLALAAVLLVPLLWAKTAGMVGLVLLLTSIGKGIFDGCIYAAMHDVVPPHARATAVGMMTMIGFFGAGLSPLIIAWMSGSFGLAAGMTSMAAAYVAAVAIILAMSRATRRAVVANAQFAHA
ncbi:MFS transporter [Sphingomonas sp. ID1715]|uniref:MFS transporter n=1 Tax=Sphingomonas sp. ID1715 TaxID=1656898 RepID=UPI001489FF29|nr:MFS transporter [Sphingomonas sp. ID1715]NNM76485.1 MFS transporter [Sphingomonas sp. ID1715]